MKKIIFMLSVLLVACFTPMDKEYVKDTFVIDCKQLYDEGYVDSTDLLSILRYTTVGQFEGVFTPDVKRYKLKHIVYEAREYVRKIHIADSLEKVTHDSLVSLEMARMDTLRLFATVKVVKKEYDDKDVQDYVVLTVQIENISPYTIDALKGDIVFVDKFGKEIYTIEAVFASTILTEQTHTTRIAVTVNSFLEDDVVFNSTPLEYMVCHWMPTDIKLK